MGARGRNPRWRPGGRAAGEPVRVMGDGGARDGATAGEPGTGDHGGARE